MLDKEAGLRNLVIASLMGEGEAFKIQNNKVTELCVPFSREKSFYLLNYLENYRLAEYVNVQPRKSQFKISLTVELIQMVNQWFMKGNKIFSKRIGETLLSYKAIIVFINLFGIRKLDGIGIETTINKEYIRTLAYYMEKNLSISVFAGTNQVKVTEVPSLLLETINKVSTIESTEIANFLTIKEKNQLVKLISHKGMEEYV